MQQFSYTISSISAKYPIGLDLYLPTSGKAPHPLVVFMHGFKGFKDWGHWAAIANGFVEAGYAFLKFNFSHNGTTIDALQDFADLEAFGRNTFSIELADSKAILDWLQSDGAFPEQSRLQTTDLTLIGHSRGGPIALITALEQEGVGRVVTWAGVHELNYSWADRPQQLQAWSEQGVQYILNGRTGQQMPLYYSLYEDYERHRDRLSIATTLEQLDKPYLIVHGTKDPAVSAQSAAYLEERGRRSQLHLIEGADHVFGGYHPFGGAQLPEHSQELLQKTVEFIEQTS